MNTSIEDLGDCLSTADARLLEQVCDRFETEFRKGGRPRIEELLQGLPRTVYDKALTELIYLDLYYRERSGQSPTLDEYRARFPSLKPTRLATAIEKRPTSSSVNGQSTCVASQATQFPVSPIGDYEILAELARGGMGIVYKARQISLDRVVALKMVRGGALATSEAAERLVREAEAAASLNHPNIVSIHSVGEHLGQHFFVMRYVEGRNLSSHIEGYAVSRAQDRAELKKRLIRAADLTAKVALAVHHANQRGILHRDLKPANIIIDPSGEPHVTDFGLARRIDNQGSLTPSGCTIGTPSYIAPEQVLGVTDVTIQADVYGLGAILYELLTGSPPFTGANAMEILLQVRDREPTQPRSICPKIDRDLETICLKCLRKQPRHRYPSADCLAEDLKRFIAGQPIQARPAGALERGWKWARRRPTVAALWAAVVLITVAALAGLTWAWQQSRTALGEKEQALQMEVQARANEMNARILATRQRERAELTLYYQSIGLAHRDWQAGKVSSAEAILDGCAPEFRGWEWHYLKRLCHPEIMRLPGHSSSIAALAYSPDGTRLAAASGVWGRWSPSEIRIWNTQTGKEVAVCTGHAAAVRGIAYSPDGKRLVSASWDGSVRVWNADTGEQLLEKRAHRGVVHAVAFSPDGCHIASGSSDQTLILWDAHTGEPIHTFARLKQAIHCVAFSPDGQAIAAAGYSGIIQVWHVATREELHRRADLKDIRAIAFSPDGKRIATGGYDRVVTVWNLKSMTPAVTYAGHSGPINAVAFSPDGLHVASADTGGDVKVWDARTGRISFNVRGHTGAIVSLAFHPSSPQLACGGDDRAARIWDLTRDPESRNVGARYSLTSSLAFDAERHHLYGISGSNWAARNRNLMNADLVRGDYRTFGFPPIESTTYSAVAYCPESKLFVLGCEDGTVRLGPAQDAPILRGHSGPVNSVGVRSDGLQAASAGTDGTIRVWQPKTRTEQHTLRGHVGKANCVVYHPEEKLLASAGKDRTVRLWNSSTGEPVAVLIGHQGPVTTVAFSRDGKTLATAGEDQLIMIWDVQTAIEVGSAASPRLTLHGHVDAVTGLAFTSDGRRLFSSSLDWTVILWDVASGHRALTLFDSIGGIRGMALSPDDRYLVSATRNLRIWEGGTLFDQMENIRSVNHSDVSGWRQGEIRRGEFSRNWYGVVFQSSALLKEFSGGEALWMNHRSAAYAELGMWSKAVGDFREMLLLHPTDPASWYGLTVAHCAAGEESAYIESLKAMCLRYRNTDKPETASLVVTAAVTEKAPILDRNALLRLAQLAQRCPNTGPVYARALCRAGDYRESLQAFRQVGQELRASDLLFQAKAHSGLGQSVEARASLVKALKWIENADQMEADGCERVWVDWSERVRVKRLLREVEGMFSEARPN